MTRIYVTEIDTDHELHEYFTDPNDPRQPQRRAGFFTQESATYWHGDKRWDGENRADINTKDSGRGEGIYRTAQGRWVLRSWSNWQGEDDTHAYITETDARDWLIFNGYDEDADKHFGPIEDERGPGRPEIGAPVQVRLGDLLPMVDAWAAERGVKRAEAVRQLVSAGLDNADYAF